MNLPKPFIAELHDIGKLVDWDAPGLNGKMKPPSPRHGLHSFDFSQLEISPPSSPSWWGQFSDEVKSLTSTKVPRDYVSDVILTNIADELAASISRTWGGSKEFQEKKAGGKLVAEGLNVLWNPDFYEREVIAGRKWAAADTPKELKAVLRFIDECNDSEEFFEKYNENLKHTAEDKSVPINIISLLTHLELTGKIYRVLKRSSKFDQQRKKLIYAGGEVQQISEATGGRINETDRKGKWIYRLISCRVDFSQSLIRLQDLNIFKKRTDLIKEVSEDAKTKDHVLFCTDDFMCLFMPKEGEIRIKELLKPFLEAGFLVNYRELEAELNLLTSSMEKAYRRFHSSSTTRYLKLHEKRDSFEYFPEIRPPLCDSCQVRCGRERVKEQIYENLCDACYEIRQMGEPAREYAEWEGKAAWARITLDQDQLLEALHRLFGEYVDRHPAMQTVRSGDKTELKESFRPLAVQMDFVKDYKLVLEAFRKQIYEAKDEEGNALFTKEKFLYPIENYYEFGIFKVYCGQDIMGFVDLFCSLLKKHFPACLDNCPIKLSLSVANVKYPYQEHWRFLSMPENTINIQTPGGSRLIVDIQQYELLKQKIGKGDWRLSHFLYRVSNIEAKTGSDMTVMLEILQNRKQVPTLLELTQHGLSVHQILNFYRLTQEEAIL